MDKFKFSKLFQINFDHPRSNVNSIKNYIYHHNMFVIVLMFFFLYFLMSLFFSIGYYLSTDGVPFKGILKFALLSSFGFSVEKKIANTDVFFIYNLLHQMASLLMSTIFTAVVVLKYFFLPTFFVFKKKCNLSIKCDLDIVCNHDEDGDHNEICHIVKKCSAKENCENSELIITLYNSSDLFVTNCHIRVYGREESLDKHNKKSLININNKEPIFDYTYPFMDQHPATRLRIEYQKKGYQTLINWFDTKKVKNRKLDLIILVEANVSKLDSPIYEIHRYTIDSENIAKTIDFKEPASIDLNFDNFSESDGWDNFEN